MTVTKPTAATIYRVLVGAIAGALAALGGAQGLTHEHACPPCPSVAPGAILEAEPAAAQVEAPDTFDPPPQAE